MRRAARRDENEAAIVAALQSLGWHVTKVSAPGFPDLVCIRRGQVVHVEVKMPGGKMERAQVDLHEAWERAGLRIPVVSSPRQLDWVGEPGWWLGANTYRDFPWEGHTAEQKAQRLATSSATAPPGPRTAPPGR